MPKSVKQVSHLIETRSQAMVKDKVGPGGYVLLTPPLEPNWERVKNEVADRYVSKRTIAETRTQVLQDCYGRGCG